MKKALLVLFLSSTVFSWAKPAKNLILILADDLGWADTTLYGKTSLYETPNIERLAKRGMTFSNAYSSPICSPTRASILTGQNPARHGMTSPAAHLARGPAGSNRPNPWGAPSEILQPQDHHPHSSRSAHPRRNFERQWISNRPLWKMAPGP